MLIGLRRNQGPRSFQKGRYLVQSLLGEGSTGVVYEVRDQELDGERIALKVFHAQLLEDEVIYERFRKQILLLRQLSHPNIVQVYDFDRDELGNHFLTMELVQGIGLNSILKESQPPQFTDCLILLSEVAKGLAYAHSSGMIHTELSPGNILLSSNGQVKICDFGISRCFEDSMGLTRTGELLSNPAFSSPEKIKGELIDKRSDVYSFGVIAYHLVTGKPPFAENDFFRQAEAQVTQAIPELRTPNGEILPLWFHDFVSKCCEKEPRKRYESAGDVLERLEEQIRFSETVLPEAFDITFIQKIWKARRFRIHPFLLAFFVFSFFVLGYVVCIQTNTRRFVGVWTLRAEKKLGFELTYLKRPFRVTASVLRPNDFLASLSQPDPGNIDYYAYILAGGELGVVDSAGNGIGHVALGTAEMDILQLLKDRGFDLNRWNARRETILLRALRLHRPNVAHYLRSLGSNFDLCDKNSVCPIHLAVQNKYADLIESMSFGGADVTVRDADGLSLFHTLARDHDFERLQMFIQRIPSRKWHLDTRDREGKTPLMYATFRPLDPGLIAMIFDLLLRSGARLEARDDLGRTALMHAFLHKNPSAVKELLRFGADKGSRDGAGRSVQEYAEEAGLAALLG